MRDFVAPIVRAATSIDAGKQLWSPLRCLRARGRKPCAGRIRLRLDAPTSRIVWSCSGCGDNGIIRGWECTEHDLGGPPAADERTADAVGFVLPERDYHVLASVDLVDLEAEQLVRAARYLPSFEASEAYDDVEAYDHIEAYEPDEADDDAAVLLVGERDTFRALSAEIGIACRLERSAARRRRLLRLHAALDQPPGP
jgi:hypothetical protein